MWAGAGGSLAAARFHLRPASPRPGPRATRDRAAASTREPPADRAAPSAAGSPPGRSAGAAAQRATRRAETRRPETAAPERAGAQTAQTVARARPRRRARPWFSTVGRVSFPSLSSCGAGAVHPQLGLSAVLIPCALAAQAPAAVQRAANSITAEGVRHHIGVLANDSMLGRATPSPQLEQVAPYAAAQSRRLGLKAASDTGSPHRQ